MITRPISVFCLAKSQIRGLNESSSEENEDTPYLMFTLCGDTYTSAVYVVHT